MGIYIKGMEMPENCFKCPAHEWYDFGGENHGYQCPILRTTKAVSNCEARTKRRDNCPMIPVPPHGRLIDGDYAEKDLIHDYAYAAAQMVKNYPTIIPAEEV